RLYRASRGRLGRAWLGAPVMALETVGRKRGKPRSTAVLYLRDGDDLVVVPSNAGSSRVPAWWLNLEAAGEGHATVGGERRRVRPRVAEGEERDRLWREFVRMYPQAEDYTGFTERQFPVVVLEKV
ncbi:MAG TPA: nitroreductase/quinone reductase family protein, partial [Solirubrobacteraceae bacterium]|nr:nitroreductase/quinone reductase family protein [Solirubrobacteraceae bacterium]